MHIHIETKSRWRFTLTSPNHDKSPRPGANSLASHDSKSTATTTYLNPKTSLCSVDAQDIVEGARLAPNSTSRPTRPRNFRKRICRFLVDLARMDPENTTDPYYYVDEPLPPYQYHGLPELDAEPKMQELPGMIPVIHEYYPHELAGETSYQSFPLSFPIAEMESQNVPARSDTRKWSHAAGQYPMQQGALVATPAHMPSSNTDQQLYPPPVMTSGDFLHESSPVSPWTSGSDAGSSMRHQSSSSFPNGNGSFYSPVVSPYTGEEHPYDTTPRYTSSTESPVREGSTEISATTTPIAGGHPFGSQHYANFTSTSSSSHNFPTYPEPRHESLTSQHPAPNPNVPWRSSEGYLVGTWELENSRWERRPVHERDMANNNNNNPLRQGNASDKSYRLSPEPPQICQHEGDPVHSASNTEQTVRYPLAVCDLCSAEFTGKYGKGNLTRHVREKHGLVNSTVGRVCRICKQIYNRTDAKRKHEWKKHRLADSKPTKRRN